MSSIKKFRVWDKENKTFSLIADESLVLEQYTGVKDDNGKDIYEGDIIEFFDHSHEAMRREVIMLFGAFGVNETEEDFWPLMDVSCNYGGIEIVGNIHEERE